MAHFRRAVSASPDDPQVQLDFAEFYRERALATSDPDERHAFAETAREHYRRSLELEERIPETHAGLGATYLIAGEDPVLGLEPIQQARELLPASLEIALLEAELLVQLGSPESARRRANAVLARTRSEKTLRAARAIVQHLDQAP